MDFAEVENCEHGTHGDSWSTRELQFLKDNYAVLDMKDILSALSNRSERSIVIMAFKMGMVRHFRNIDENFFKTWSPEMAWCLGLMVTDGNLASQRNILSDNLERKRLNIKNTDKEIIDKFVMLTKSTYKVGIVNVDSTLGFGHRKKCFSTNISSEIIYDDLVALGLKERKSLDIEWNGDKVPLQFMPDYIRGLWDGDGGIYWRPERSEFSCSLTSGSHNFIYGLSHFLDERLGLSKHTISKKLNSVYVLQLYGYNAYKLCRYIYHDKMGDAYLTRKYNVWLKYKEMKGL